MAVSFYSTLFMVLGSFQNHAHASSAEVLQKIQNYFHLTQEQMPKTHAEIKEEMMKTLRELEAQTNYQNPPEVQDFAFKSRGEIYGLLGELEGEILLESMAQAKIPFFFWNKRKQNKSMANTYHEASNLINNGVANFLHVNSNTMEISQKMYKIIQYNNNLKNEINEFRQKRNLHPLMSCKIKKRSWYSLSNLLDFE